MALEGSLQDQLFGHACGDEAMQRIKVREGEEREKSKALLQNLGESDGKAVASVVPALNFFCGIRALSSAFGISGEARPASMYQFSGWGVIFQLRAFDRSWRRGVAGEFRVVEHWL